MTTYCKNREYFKTRIPIDKSNKNFLIKWWGKSEFTAELKSTIGLLLLMSCRKGEPDFEQESQYAAKLDKYSEELTIYVPRGHYFPLSAVTQFNKAVALFITEQLVTVMCLKRNTHTASAEAVIEAFQRDFELTKSRDALEKASQRMREQRNLPRFMTRKK